MALTPFSTPVVGAGPGTIDVKAFDAAMNSMLAEVEAMFESVDDVLGAIVTGLSPRGSWAAVAPFPLTAAKGDFWVVNSAGTVDGQAFAVGDWLIALVTGASATTFAGNWARADYSRVVRQTYANATALLASSEIPRGVDALWATQDGHQYREAAAAAADHHVSTAGGVKLYVLPGPNGYSLPAFGAGIGGDDTEALRKALRIASGSRLDGRGIICIVTASIEADCENVIVENVTIDLSRALDLGGSPDRFLRFEGSQGTAQNLIANASKGADLVSVGSSASFVVDGYAWIESDAVMHAGTNLTLGQMVKIKEIVSATQVRLYDRVLYNFATSQTATLAPVTMKRNITLRNVRVLGSGANLQNALWIERCASVRLERCSFDFVDYVAIGISRSADVLVDAADIRHARSTGLSYGIVVANGCYGVRIVNGYGEDLRHYVTLGDNGGMNLFVTVQGCHIGGSRDAGIDAHPACDYLLVDGNTIQCSAEHSGHPDGIVVQGNNAVLTNNIIIGAARHSVLHQLLNTYGSASSIISGNVVRDSGEPISSRNAIIVANEAGASLMFDGVTIAGNVLHTTSDQHIQVYAVSGNISNIAISGNIAASAASSRSCLCRAAAGYALRNLSLCGNVFQSSGAECVYLLGAITSNILDVAVSGNVIEGGTNGLRLILTQGLIETGNRFVNQATARYHIDAGSADVALDRRSSRLVTVTAPSYVVEAEDQAIIVSHAGTVALTLPSAAAHPGRLLKIKTVQAQSVNSAAANVVTQSQMKAGVEILPTIPGAWAELHSDGTNWIIMQTG